MHDGHFHVGPVEGLLDLGGEAPKIGILDTVLLAFIA